MRKLSVWWVAAVLGLLAGAAIWWASSYAKDHRDPLNKSDAFVHHDGEVLSWFELTSRNGKVKGKLHQQKVIEETGEPPFMEEKTYDVTGKVTDKGYVFNVNFAGKWLRSDAWFSGENLVQKQGKKDSKLYEAVGQEQLKKFVEAKQEELQNAIYHSEEKEKNRIRGFFSELKSVYGYLSSSDDESYQLFLKIDEALLEGELTGSLLVMNKVRGGGNLYKERKYELNGITDGRIVRFYTNVEGKETKLEGNFLDSAAKFNLSFWKTAEKLTFHAVTEDKYKKRYEEFKVRAQK
ncbi:hypothetical protein D1B31_06815 [Neobacillus notoginsengisoli]|uniref:Uncharacterized protein n=1 Tax=Neobacillus notoginsengisoli TaxID=1578198 RepID=A0A417YVT0_9BACI|nr:hypothetical protein [Neobacillus notoginsengisoli]RHW41434.1 hypothetical protein D1B31_06815 [Neobacillus notoginsengisoli]